jgi:hypothetical protein
VVCLILKERKIPLINLKLDALLRRLPKDYPKRQKIEEDFAKKNAGYRGEEKVDYYLKDLPNKFRIIHDLRLPRKSGDSYFQMDTLIVSPYFFLILEIKNFFGTLYFDPLFRQMIRTKDGNEEGFLNPIIQVNSQKEHLQAWMDHLKFPSLPVIPLVVVSNPSTILKTSSTYKEALQTVILADTLPTKIKEHEKLFSLERLSNKELRKITRALIHSHTPLEKDVLQSYQIPRSDLLTGVQCPHCFSLPMERFQGKWICSHCTYKSKNAHIQAIQDYALLIDTFITNREAREFLHLSSNSIAGKLLKAMKLESTGSYKDRKYILSPINTFVT